MKGGLIGNCDCGCGCGSCFGCRIQVSGTLPGRDLYTPASLVEAAENATVAGDSHLDLDFDNGVWIGPGPWSNRVSCLQVLVEENAGDL